MDAAERAKEWFAKKFIANHICRGYWEDVSGAGGKVQLSWEAYEFAIAANAFAEMQDAHLAIKAAENAATWIWTRVIDCREYFNSYGHVDEQCGWPPATYLSPMFGLAAQTAYRLSGNDLFRNFSGAAKTIGWWTVKNPPQGIWPTESEKSDIGGSFWPLEGTQFVPLEEPFTVTYWVDWVSSQQLLICLRWLINEVNLKSDGRVKIDTQTLTGTILGKSGKVALHPEEMNLKTEHEQINWLGFKTEDSRILAIINHDSDTAVTIDFRSIHPNAPFHTYIKEANGLWKEHVMEPSNSLEIGLPARGCALIEWRSKSSPMSE